MNITRRKASQISVAKLFNTANKSNQNQKQIQNQRLLKTPISDFESLYKEHISQNINKFATIYKIIFSSLTPQNDLDNLDTIPNYLNFRFSFWDNVNYYTEAGTLSKPLDYKANFLSTSPDLPIFKNNNEFSISLTFDPSNYFFIDYKKFIYYLFTRELFIEIYDCEKRMPYAFCKIPLKKFLRKNGEISGNIFANLYDNFTYKSRGKLLVKIKSEELRTLKDFNPVVHSRKLELFNSKTNEFPPVDNNKKIVTISAAKYKKIVNDKNFSISKIYNFNSSNTSKMLKNKRKSIFEKNLCLTLIQGEPHYFNYLLTNDTNEIQIYHIGISSNGIISLIYDRKEYEFITILKGLQIPYDYHSISKDGTVIIQPNQSLPIIIKCLSYNSFLGNEQNFMTKHSIMVYDNKNVPKFYLNIEIFKVFPIIDFEFYYNIPENKSQKIKFINPCKESIIKSNELLKNFIYLNTVDNEKNGIENIEIQLDQKTHEFFFEFNNNFNLGENQFKLPNENEKINLYGFYGKNINKLNTLNINGNNNLINKQRLLFFYKDMFKSQLLTTFRFIINAYECINFAYDLGVLYKKHLNLSLSIPTKKKLKFYSSNENLLFFDDKYKNDGLEIESNKSYEINFNIRIKQEGYHEILINCVDVNSNEVAKTWLIQATMNKSNISRIVKVDYKIDLSTELAAQISFQSPLNIDSVLYFTSSQKTVIELPESQIEFKAKETKNISINIRQKLIPGFYKEYVFITDENELFYESIQFDVNYFKE